MAATATLLLLSFVWWQGSRWYASRLLSEQRAAVSQQNALYVNAFSAIVNRRLARLQGLYAYTQSRSGEAIFADNFDSFAAGLYAASQGIRSLAIAPEGRVEFVYPLFGNEGDLGYEPLKDPALQVRRDAQLAQRTGLTVLSAPYHSLEGELQLVGQQALYEDSRFWGFVRIVLDLPFLLEEAGLSQSDGELQFALRSDDGHTFYGDPALFDRQPVTSRIDLPGAYWELAAVPHGGWEQGIQQPLRVAQAAGLAIVALLGLLVYLTASQQQRLSLAVQARTRQLSEANEALRLSRDLLEQRVAERTQELSGLYAVTAALLEKVSLAEVLDVVCSQAQQLTRAAGSAVYLVDQEESGWLRLAFCLGSSLPVPQQLSVAGSASGRAIQTRQPVLVNEPALSNGDPLVNDLRAQSMLAVPLIVHGTPTGALHVVDKPGGFVLDDERIIRLFADQAAVAIENARLAQKAERLAVMEERTRLARELHDSVTQSLYSLLLFAEAGRSLPTGGDGERLQHQLARIGETAQEALAEMRLLLHELRPPVLEQVGLVGALHQRFDVVERRAGVQARLLVDEVLRLPPETEACLYRIAIEALNNVLKHARARVVTVQLRMEGENAALVVADDGVGFDPAESGGCGLGLTGMRERAERCGGTLSISSQRGRGTRVVVRVPAAARTSRQDGPDSPAPAPYVTGARRREEENTER